MRGTLPLPVAWGKYYMVYAGKYYNRPQGTFGVRMAVEIDRPADVVVPVIDFSIPTEKQMLKGLRQTLVAVLMGRQVYVGCMGGIGRTGLMLGALTKAWGIQDPVRYVRSQYYAHALETPQQEQFIGALEIPEDVLHMVARAKRRSWLWPFGDRNLNRLPHKDAERA